MLLTNVRRIARSGFANFWRNRFVSLSAILVMLITLSVIVLVVFMGAILDASLRDLQSKVDVNVYFLPDASEEDILEIRRRLEALPEVAAIEYVTREEALAAFRERHADDQLIIQGLEELGENPLGAVLNVQARQPDQYESVAKFLEGDSVLGAGGVTVIESINYFNNKAAINKLGKIIESADRLGLALTIISAVMSVIITFNTIRLVIYTAREEISVMRLVGASNSYIQGPFVVGGILYGFIAGLLSLVIFYPLTLWLGPTTERFFGTINVFDYYVENFGEFFVITILTGMCLGALSSFLAVKKYLNV